MKGRASFVILGLLMLALPQRGMTQEVTDYLILQDVGVYKLHRQSREFPDRKLRDITPHKIYKGTAGILNATGHFVYDHYDVTYETGYESNELDMAVEVQITQHSGSDSDKWLLHEVDVDFRNYYGMPGKSYSQRNIDGQNILEDSASGRNYRWLSGNKVIVISYFDSQMTKPEPLEVVKAYLTKHPSTITPLTLKQLRSAENKTIWIKDEMDRRLWLADKWVAQIIADDPKLYDKLDEVVKSLGVFLNYKEKYFGISEEEKAAGITAKSEQKALNIYLQQKDTDSIKTKLAAYKVWWAAHKGDAIKIQ